jgi:hypothetical protein
VAVDGVGSFLLVVVDGHELVLREARLERGSF